MLPRSLLPETISRANGVGPVTDVSQDAGRLLVLTLGITRIIEQESLELSVWGSPDKDNWGTKPIALFPQKSYCGMYSILLNLSARPEIKYLRVQWKMNRWTKGNPNPLFGFFVDSELSGTRIRSASAGASTGPSTALARAVAS